MASTITLVFNGTLTTGESISLKPVDLLKETFVSVRTSPYVTPINIISNGAQAQEYVKAFNLDYNQLNEFTIQTNNNIVNITHAISGYFDVNTVVNTTNGAIIIQGVVNTPTINPINITNITFSQATSNPCKNVKVNVTTDVLAVKVNSPIVIDPNTNNPFSFDIVRGQIVTLEVVNSDGQIATDVLKLPQTLSLNNLNVSIVNSPIGATAIIELINVNNLDLQYSLDNTNWQTSNIFNSLITGNYTVYVKDQLGCLIQKDFIIDSFESSVSTLKPFVKISKINSLRFAKRDSSLKNDENTLSCEAIDINKRQEIQLFEKSDIITTEILTSYKTTTVTIVKDDLTEVVIPVVKESSNIGIKEKRDAIKYDLGNSKTGIYFTTGNTYDYDTDVLNGTYALNGGLPTWGVIGNYVLLGLNWLIIEDIIYDESKSAEVIVVSEAYTGLPTSLIVGTVYNKEDFEVYNFTIDMNLYDRFQVNCTFTDPNFTDETHLSEIIDVKPTQENTIKLEWWNDENIGLFYETGIKNLIHIPFEYSKAFEVFESDSEKTDTSAYLVSSQVYEGEEFFFGLVTKEIKRKIFKAFAHSNVYLNGVRYVISDNPEDTHLIGTNLYRISVKMIKATDSYNSQVISEISNTNVDLIKLINSGTNYIEY